MTGAEKPLNGERTDRDAVEEMRRRLRAGDREGACELVVDATRGPLFSYLMSMLRDREAAREAFQDAYVRVFRSLDGFRGGSSLVTWVLTIGRNAALNRMRREKVRERHAVPLDDAAPPSVEPEPPPISRGLAEAVRGLPEEQRDAVLLFYVEERSVAEVSTITRRPVNTVKSDLLRARRTLRAVLEGTASRREIS